MIENARGIALQALEAVEEHQAYANLKLGSLLRESSLSRSDRGMATELVMGVLRRQITLDFALDFLLERPKTVRGQARQILRLGAYQILFLEDAKEYAAVYETVELAKSCLTKGQVPLINGLLRNLIRQKKEIPWPLWEKQPEEYLHVMTSHPLWLVRRWMKQYGNEKARQMLQANNLSPGVSVRVNTLKATRESLLEQFKLVDGDASPSLLVPEGIRLNKPSGIAGLPGFEEGFFQVQDESSMLVAHAIDPQPGELIVDVCSAPGGKACHLAQKMVDIGTIIAWDVHPHKLQIIKENVKRLGITSVKTELFDAREKAEELAGKADRVLVDAPCSGLGVLRRKPEIRYRMSEKLIKELVELQAKILQSASALVRPGGVLVYSTCTTEPEENFGQIKLFLQQNPDFEPEDLQSFLPFAAKTEEERRQQSKGFWQLHTHLYHTDGFFISRLRRKQV